MITESMDSFEALKSLIYDVLKAVEPVRRSLTPIHCLFIIVFLEQISRNEFFYYKCIEFFIFECFSQLKADIK